MHVRNLTPIKLSSVRIRMLVFVDLIASRRFASSHGGTHSPLEISYPRAWLEDWLHPWGGMYSHGYMTG